MYVQSNIMARSLYVYTSSAIQIALYHFTQRKNIYGDLMSPATIERT
jgi:hypothetical protein